MILKPQITAQWTLATTLAIAFAGVALTWLGRAFPYAGGLALGIPVAIAQWLVLRRRVTGANGWIAATIVGFGLMWLVGFAFAALKGMSALRTFIAFAAATPVLGAMQSRIARRWSRFAPWWIVTSAIGWTSFFGVIEMLPGTGMKEMVLGGALAGAITGAAMGWLLEPAHGMATRV